MAGGLGKLGRSFGFIEREIIVNSPIRSDVLPLYQCHKKVRALKIERVELCEPDRAGECDALITPADTRFGAFFVDEDYLKKHKPMPGGYWVQYEDGYNSYSPAEAFESGYTLIEV